MTTRHSNRLARETSPYLLQHAHNPVDWFPWGAEALERARQADKPILVSIGYSACHWCHVMEHESFEDEDVARVMNELFVCIKVDREERPDLDKIYQTAHQILAQRPGGWPLNMFLTPQDHMPFFAGTYFPKTPRHGMPGFVEILERVAHLYREKRDSVTAQNDSLRQVFARIQPAGPAPGMKLDAEVFGRAFHELERQFDARYGGFGGAPKFPHPTSIELCLRFAARHNGHAEAQHIALHTLRAMANGGLYDQVGGGFYRYAVDERWEIPHFEKMLYDNAQLLPLYVDAYPLTGEAPFKRVALETARWVMREMQSPEGGYYSTLDADSEGHEGKFYVWSTEEIRAAVSEAEWECLELRYGLRGTPNFEGRWHLHGHLEPAQIAGRLTRTEGEVEEILACAQAKLFEARINRVRPGRDEKVITSWNGLTIQAMARAGRVLGEPAFIDSAQRAAAFAHAQLWKDGRLLAVTKDGRAHLMGYLDDYGFLMAGLLELLQARWDTRTLEFLRAVADTLLAHFEDESHGGFFFTADDHERLVYRPKPASDEATPSGNGVAAQALLKLGHLLGDLHYLHAAERALEGLHAQIAQYPSAHGTLVMALEDYLLAGETVILRGAPAAMAPWQERLARTYAPTRQVYAIPADEKNLPGVLAERRTVGPVTAYLCAGQSCRPPVTEVTALETLLTGATGGPI